MTLNPIELRRLAQEMHEKLGCDAGNIAHAQSEAAYLAGEFHKYKHWRSVAAAISEIDGVGGLLG